MFNIAAAFVRHIATGQGMGWRQQSPFSTRTPQKYRILVAVRQWFDMESRHSRKVDLNVQGSAAS